MTITLENEKNYMPLQVYPHIVQIDITPIDALFKKFQRSIKNYEPCLKKNNF